MDTLFQGKTALITGGSSGIGYAIAEKWTRAGANVTLLARDEAKLQAACARLQGIASASQRVDFLSLDVADNAAVMQAIPAYVASHGAPDWLINSAGIAHPGHVQDLDVDIFRRTMEINYLGTVHVTKALLPALIARRSGHIINISSIAGFLSVYGYAAYSPSKFAVRAFSDVLRYELREYNIRISVVFPPDTQTPQLDYENQYKPAITKILDESNKVITPEAVAEAVFKGAARGQYIITPGFDSAFYYALVNTLGGLTYRAMDWMIAAARRKISAAERHRPQ